MIELFVFKFSTATELFVIKLHTATKLLLSCCKYQIMITVVELFIFSYKYPATITFKGVEKKVGESIN